MDCRNNTTWVNILMAILAFYDEIATVIKRSYKSCHLQMSQDLINISYYKIVVFHINCYAN